LFVIFVGESYEFLPVGPFKVKRLCSLVLWLVTSIKELKDSGYIGLVHEIGVLSSDKNAVPCFCLAKLLRKLLNLSITGERCMIDAALLLIEMVNGNSVKEKLRKLPVLSLPRLVKVSSLPQSRTICNEQGSLEKATETLEMFKLQLKRQKNACLTETGTTAGPFNTSTPEKHNRWSVAKSWTPCPIGTIPCSFSSCAVLPAFDAVDHGLEVATSEQHGTFDEVDHSERFESQSDELDGENILQISRSSPEYDISDMPELTSPLKGRLLVGGVWKKVSEEELLLIKSKMNLLL
jgi:ribosomal biogenesis protein LAS1